MNRYALSVIAAFATACLATGALAQQGPPGGLNVNVVNTPLPVQIQGGTAVTGSVSITNQPLSVQVVGQAQPVPFAGMCNSFIPIGDKFADCKISIPPGNRLVLKNISAHIGVDPGNGPTTLFVYQDKPDGLQAQHTFPFFFQSSSTSVTSLRLAFYSAGESLDWTFDPIGVGVHCNVSIVDNHQSDNANPFSCTATGYLLSQ
jgi:hypothetical protein